jgi:tRNA1(Val) A37 N6-methylase TrmN6
MIKNIDSRVRFDKITKVKDQVLMAPSLPASISQPPFEGTNRLLDICSSCLAIALALLKDINHSKLQYQREYYIFAKIPEVLSAHL